ncbi:MAG: 50S ribosomal protein L18 [Candidatus Moranbacteria bacterium GW2011_GWE1_49_15]|nr:MAG: 50S ribosomal protein L18 [Candidatus Moranbacteria bacterium GW2011_GWE2_47_10]KKW07457.1 MAG: 50S ribosomal protein L18 [Candidatus Moranbacteria bacterium GW2011_GWE1_49_15]HBP01125.1 50S ribosomal protein L18 [Candidatus Moranbacteria bacterium]
MKKIDKKELRLKRRRRVRAKVSGTSERPRLAVYKSLTNIYAQLIDDVNGRTLAQANIKEITKSKNDMDGATQVGKLIAKKGKEAKIEDVVFDRGGYNYHGKIKALADGAREGGLKF